MKTTLTRAQHEKIMKENARRVLTLKDKNRVRKGKNGVVEKKKGKDVVPREKIGKQDTEKRNEGSQRDEKSTRPVLLTDMMTSFPKGGKGNCSEHTGRFKVSELNNNGSARSRRSIFSWTV